MFLNIIKLIYNIYEYYLQLGWFANPIFGKDGDYPPIMRKLIDAQSAAENRSISKLPYFTKEEIKLLKGKVVTTV